MRPLALAALLLAGCAEVIGADEYKVGGGAPASCAPITGTFNFHFEEWSGGGCGPIDDRLVAISIERPGDGKLPDGCTGYDIISSNLCNESATITCPGPDGKAQTVVASIDYAGDGRSGRGTWQIEIRDSAGKLLCGSVYNVTVTRV